MRAWRFQSANGFKDCPQACCVTRARMDNPKRRRLAELCSTKNVSDSALGALLRNLKASDLEAGAPKSRRSIARALEADATTQTVYGPLLCTIPLLLRDGKVFDWHIVDPAALVNWMCFFSKPFDEAFCQALEDRPCYIPTRLPLDIFLQSRT